MVQSPSRVVLFLYRCIARVAPRRMRDRFADEQTALFEDVWAQERPSGPVAARVFTIRLFLKAIASVCLAWLDVVRAAPSRWGGETRIAIRGLAHAPWYAFGVVGVLTAGITLATVVFALVDGVLFKPLPYSRPDEIYLIRPQASTAPQRPPHAVAARDIAAWARAVPELQFTIIRSEVDSGTRVDGRDYFQRTIDERFFDVVGTRPMAGGFLPQDFNRESWMTPSGMFFPVLISHAIWTTQFGGDLSIIGKPVVLSERDGGTFGRIVRGVLPPDFVFPIDLGEGRIDMLSPTSSRVLGSADEDGLRFFQVVARVPAGLSAVEAESRLTAATRTMPASPVEVDRHGGLKQSNAPFDSVQLVPVAEHLGERSRPTFALVAAGAAVLLLLACVNVAGLTVARGFDRSRDLAVRKALGATRWALVRGVLLEVVLLVFAGVAVAFLAAPVVLAWTISLLPNSLALIKTPVIDGRVFAAAGIMGAASVGLVLLWPAISATRVRVSVTSGRLATTTTRLGRRARMSLVVGQVALGFVLLIAGGLTLLSLARSWKTDLGYRRDRTVVLEAFSVKYSKNDGQRQVAALRDELRRASGVTRVAATTIRLFWWRGASIAQTAFVPVGSSGPFAGFEDRRVDFDFFEVTGLRVLEGQLPNAQAWADGQPNAVVSRLVAQKYWPGQNAVGQTLVWNWNGRSGDEPARRVAAVVNDTRFLGVEQDPLGTIYLPGAVGPNTYGSFLLVQTAGEAGPMVAPLAALVRARGMRLEQASTLEDAIARSIRHRMLPAWLFGSLGATAIVMLTAGVLGLMAMATAQRAKEIGIRIALGSSAGRLSRLLVREQLSAVALGLFAGAGIAALIARRVESQLYGVSPFDPSVWTAVAAVLLVVAGLGAWIPARIAARLDPIQTLRAE
jgi:predicted permease